MNDILLDVLYVVISAALTVGGAFAVRYIRSKTNWQYKNEIAEAVTIAVAFVQQTFVDGMKKNENFGVENQKKAVQKALEAVSTLLTAPAKDYLYHNRTEEEVNDYLVALIEDAVRTQKEGVVRYGVVG